MVDIIIKKDLYANIQETKVQVLALTVLCLSLIVSLLGVFEYKIKNERYLVELSADMNKLYNNQVYATLHPQAIKAPTPLAIFCKGVESNFGNSYTFDLIDIPYQATKIYESNPYIEGFINLDLSVVFIWLFSLISILVAYDSIIKEKEEGTLKLMFASQLSKTKFFISKVMSSILSVLIVWLVALFIVLIVFVLTPWIEFNGQVAYAMFLFFSLIFLYSMFWIAVATICSIVSKNSGQSLVASLAIWIVLLVGIPSVIRTVVGNTDFVDEKMEIILLQNDIMNDYYGKMDEIWNKDITPLISNLQFSTFGGSPGSEPIRGANPATTEATVKYYKALNPLKKDIADRKFDIANEKYLTPLKKNIRLYERLALLSPVSLFEQLSTQISGTSYSDQFLFFDHFKIYREQVFAFLIKRNAFDSRLWFTPET